jgi:hypothetical protein
MEVVEGKDLMVWIGTTTKKPFAFAKSHKLSITHATKDRSSKDSGIWTEKSKGRLSWEISGELLVTYDATATNFEALTDAIMTRELVTLTWAIASGTGPAWTPDATKDLYIGQAYVDKLDVTANDGDDATASFTFGGHGQFAKTNAPA